LGNEEVKKIVDYRDDGVTAVEAIEQGIKDGYVYSLILMDLSMIHMDGDEASKITRQLYSARNLPQPLIVACTAHCDQSYLNQAFEHHMDLILLKPI